MTVSTRICSTLTPMGRRWLHCSKIKRHLLMISSFSWEGYPSEKTLHSKIYVVIWSATSIIPTGSRWTRLTVNVTHTGRRCPVTWQMIFWTGIISEIWAVTCHRITIITGYSFPPWSWKGIYNKFSTRTPRYTISIFTAEKDWNHAVTRELCSTRKSTGHYRP